MQRSVHRRNMERLKGMAATTAGAAAANDTNTGRGCASNANCAAAASGAAATESATAITTAVPSAASPAVEETPVKEEEFKPDGEGEWDYETKGTSHWVGVGRDWAQARLGLRSQRGQVKSLPAPPCCD